MPTQRVPNLVQGVSQQGAQQRRDTQCDDQFDCINSASQGCIPRPHSRHVANLAGDLAGLDLTGSFFYEMVKGDNSYLFGIAVYGGSRKPFVINLETGAVFTVGAGITWTSPDAYLSTIVGDASKTFRAKLVEDTLFVANRGIAPAMAVSPVSPARDPEALIVVKAGAYDSDMKVDLTGPATVNASVSTDPTNFALANSEYIATQFETQIDGVNGYTCDRSGSTLHIYRADHADFDVATSDQNGDEIMYALKDRITSFDRLPLRAFDGVVFKIGGQNKAVDDDYYVKFVGEPSTGSWQETVAPGIKTTINKATMPHALVITSPTTFTFGDKAWSTRVAGDENNAKDPSFIGELPRDIFWHQGRFVVLYENGAVWSKARFPFTYFPDTVQTILATAPIDTKLIAGTQNQGANNMDFAVQFDTVLSLWSPRAQFKVTWGQDQFKQESISADPDTAYEYAPNCDPLSVGKSLYFSTHVGRYANFRVIHSQNQRVVGDVPITDHVPSYLEAGTRWLTGSDTLRTILTLSDGYPEGIACWNYLFDGQQYQQSAWNKWRHAGGPFLWHGFKGNVLRVLQQRADGVVLLHFDMTPGLVDDEVGATYRTRLDMRSREDEVDLLALSVGGTTTTFDLRWTPTNPDAIRVVSREDFQYTDSPSTVWRRGKQWEVLDVTGRTVTVKGALYIPAGSATVPFYVGEVYRAERGESEFYIRNDQGVVETDRLSVDWYQLSVADSAYTRIEVTSEDRPNDPRSYEFPAGSSGLPISSTGTPALRNGSIKVPVEKDARICRVRLINDTWMPSAWMSAKWHFTAVMEK